MTAEPMEQRTPETLIEDLAFLADTGVGATEAAHRVGYASAKSLDKFLRRHDQASLLNQLTRQDYLPLNATGPTRHLRTAP